MVDFEELLARKEELLEAMAKENEDKGYELFLLLITNILESDTLGLVAGDHYDRVESAFESTIENQEIKLPGVVSRKKQVVPPLTDHF